MQPKQQYNIPPMTSYSDFIAHHMGTENDHVTDDEHVAFLFYWLNAIIFYSQSVQMQKLFLPLAVLLHEENNLNLAKSWASLLAVQMIPTGLPQHKKEHFKATLYVPHYTARQLGFSQAIPTPLPKNSKPFCHITLASKKELDVCLSKNQQHREGYNHLVYDRSSFITKSCFDWWTTYYSKYSRTLEEIKNSVVRAVPVTEGSPKRPPKRKTEATSSSRQPAKKIRRTPSRTSRKLQLPPSSDSSFANSEPSIQNLLAASSKSDDTIDLDSGSPLIRRRRPVPVTLYYLLIPETIVPDSDSPSRVLETIPSPQRTSSPLKDAELLTPPSLGSGDLGIVSESTDADLITLVTILNQAVREDRALLPPIFHLNPILVIGNNFWPFSSFWIIHLLNG
ncbi:hypothetical protein Ahy_B02g057905 [Arachis hypogaea]|uniref:Aminotransferase-like plant mobile domain-containing protein n=1 Tax=Arachis hypogaea TaxID=3818 RepID=A0A445AD77_ARAHY|nr:hypothetical protein Ahy_B02g057905 [Arachis hypogaea]